MGERADTHPLYHTHTHTRHPPPRAPPTQNVAALKGEAVFSVAKVDPATGEIAGVFESVHSDLPDLELPPWCYQAAPAANTTSSATATAEEKRAAAERFVVAHRRALESDTVARRLPAWIDLTFGVALTGKRAERAMNVSPPPGEEDGGGPFGGQPPSFGDYHPLSCRRHWAS